MKSITRIVPHDLYEMIDNYGPQLRPQMSRMSYDLYALDNKARIEIEKQRMNLFANHFSQNVPSKEIIKELKKYIQNDYVLELNSGLGLWAYLLQQEMVNLVPINETVISTGAPFTKIQLMDYLEATKQYNDANILFYNYWTTDYTTLYDVIPHFNGDSIILTCDSSDVNDIIQQLSGNIFFLNRQPAEITESSDYKPLNKWFIRKEISLPQWLNHTNKVYILEKF